MREDELRAQRSAASRALLLETAIKRINAVGYAGASLADIAAHSGLSKSAIFHHFPSRAALMAEVCIEAWQRNRAGFLGALAGRDPSMSMTEAFVAGIWEQFKQPHNLAELEILIASRSDPELKAALGPKAALADAEARDLVRRLREADGLKNTERSEALYTLGCAIMRGLAMEMAIGTDPKVNDAAAIWIRAIGQQTLE